MTMGSSAVDVNSLAISGRGRGTTTDVTAADAVGQGLGAVHAKATANATETRDLSRARAEATGSSGGATAESLSGGGRFSMTRAIAEAPVVTSGVAEARADATGFLAGPGLDGSADAFSFVTATGEVPEVWGRAALGLLDRQGLAGYDILLRSEAVFAQPALNLGSLPTLVVSFLSIELGTTAFEALRFQVRNGETSLFDETFSEVGAAVDFFDGTLDLALGPGVVPLDLHFVLELQSGGANSGFSTLFALGTMPIPEPSSAILLFVGLLLLAARGSRRTGGVARRGGPLCPLV